MPDIDLKHLMTAGEFKALLAQLGWSTSDLLLQQSFLRHFQSWSVWPRRLGA
jgi:hypothetical protein